MKSNKKHICNPQKPTRLPKLQPYNSNTFRLNHYILTSSTAYLLQLTFNLKSHSHLNTPLTTPPYATLSPTIHHMCSYNDSSDPPPSHTYVFSICSTTPSYPDQTPAEATANKYPTHYLPRLERSVYHL